MHRLYIIILLGLAPLAGFTQQLADSVIQKIDHALQHWKSNTGPGCVATIVMGDNIVYAKGFGLANLEYSIPNGSNTVFNLASVSKSFTAYGVELLIEQGKVKIDADIRTYLPWVPAFKHKITVLNLLNHTSGLKDHFMLMPFNGLYWDGILDQQLALSYLKKLRNLTFVPGARYAYNNMNYVLLAEIAKQVSGKSFRDYMDSAVFKPLGMDSTRVTEGAAEIIKNRAASYSPENGSYTNFPHNIYTLGDGNICSPANDMAKWAIHFYNPANIHAPAIAAMTTPGKLNNGNALNYGAGMFIDVHRGQTRWNHKGGIAGYKNWMAIYPELKTGIILLSNSDEGPRVSAAMQAITELIIPMGNLPDPDAQISLSPKTIKDTLRVSRFAGRYIAHNGTKVTIDLKNGRLIADSDTLGVINDTLFYLPQKPSVKYRFILHNKLPLLQMETSGPNEPLVFHQISPTPVDIRTLALYTGTYKGTEVDFTFTISIKNGKLWLYNNRHGSKEINLDGPDDLYVGFYFMDHLYVVRDRSKKIIGLEFANGENWGLIFDKIK